jgi:hypothetical protein
VSPADPNVEGVSNKVRRVEPGGAPEGAVDGPALYFHAAGSAAIRDESQTLPSRRLLASLVHDFRGWIMTVRDRGTYGPFTSAEEAAGWWAANRHALPEPPRARLLSDDWPPDMPEDER